MAFKMALSGPCDSWDPRPAPATEHRNGPPRSSVIQVQKQMLALLSVSALPSAGMAPFLVKEISFSTAELPRTWPAFRLSSCFYKEGLRILQLTWLAAEVSGLHACVPACRLCFTLARTSRFPVSLPSDEPQLPLLTNVASFFQLSPDSL